LPAVTGSDFEISLPHSYNRLRFEIILVRETDGAALYILFSAWNIFLIRRKRCKFLRG
jgi:hypothetical protein